MGTCRSSWAGRCADQGILPLFRPGTAATAQCVALRWGGKIVEGVWGKTLGAVALI